MNALFFILFVALMVAGIRSFLKRAPVYGPAFLVRVALILLVLLIVFLALSGRLHWLIGLLAGLLPFLRKLLPLLLPILLRLLPFLQQARTQGQARQRSSGQQSEICTRWLKMTLDHDSGAMQGEIIGGSYRGRTLQQLSIPELADFYQQCRAQDTEAVRLLDAWIQRHHPDEWQQWQQQQQNRQRSGGADNSDELSLEDAWEILGLQPGASREEILKAHKRMMVRVHPDKGGSNYLASKINRARDLLLENL